jgi:hypothetical protein
MRAHSVSSFRNQPGNNFGPLDVRSSPGNFFVVASQGEPDFVKGPCAMSTIRARDMGANYNNTALNDPRQWSAEQYLAAHESLVTPFQKYYSSEEGIAPQIARQESGKMGLAVRLANQLTIAAHVVYSGLGVNDDDPTQRPASVLLVNRCLASTNDIVGRVDEYKGPTTDCDIDLAEVIERELEGEETNLRIRNSVETRALGAVGMLPLLETVTRDIRHNLFDNFDSD